MQAQIGDMRLALAGVGLAAIALGVLALFVLARRITRPLSQLVAGADRAAAGDLETRLEVRRRRDPRSWHGGSTRWSAGSEANTTAWSAAAATATP